MTTSRSVQAPAGVLDPLAPNEPGRYSDAVLDVAREQPTKAPFGAASVLAETEHFRVHRSGRRLQVSHRVRAQQLDNDLACLLVAELFDPGWLTGKDTFERLLTGIVRSTVADPVAAWSTFYRNTIAVLNSACEQAAERSAHTTLAGLTPVYRRALRLVPAGRVLDMGSCFGFFALMLAQRRRNTVLASDVCAGSMRLLETVARDWHRPLETLVCDAARAPLPDRAVDTVTMLHLLEHLDVEHGSAVLREAIRLAARRVVVAVPFEPAPRAVYGHVRCFDIEVLRELGLQSGRRFGVSEHHGGWLVIDTG